MGKWQIGKNNIILTNTCSFVFFECCEEGGEVDMGDHSTFGWTGGTTCIRKSNTIVLFNLKFLALIIFDILFTNIDKFWETSQVDAFFFEELLLLLRVIIEWYNVL